MFDAHNHLQDVRFDAIRDRVIAGMRDAGVRRCVVNGTCADDWPAVAELAGQHPDLVIPSFGLHPWRKPSHGWLEQLAGLLDTVPGACVGECGLDRWMEHCDAGLQEEVFLAQLRLAADRDLPLSIHCLKAWGRLVELLESNPLPKRGFLLHSYGGPQELVARLARLGAYFSFSGYFLHARKQKVREAFRKVPPDRLLFETDAPDMLPPETAVSHPLDGNLNHPGNLGAIAREASAFLDTASAGENFRRFFEEKH